MTDECKFEIKEDTFSAKMPLISKQEYKQLNSNIEGFARAITKLVIVDKNMAIAQHIIRKQQEKIEQLEAEKTEAIEKDNKVLRFLLELKKELTEELKYNSTKREARPQLSIVDKILEIMKGEKK